MNESRNRVGSFSQKQTSDAIGNSRNPQFPFPTLTLFATRTGKTCRRQNMKDNSTAIVTVAVPRCPECGSQRRTKFYGIRRIMLAGGAILVSRRTHCADCGQPRIERHTLDGHETSKTRSRTPHRSRSGETERDPTVEDPARSDTRKLWFQP